MWVKGGSVERHGLVPGGTVEQWNRRASQSAERERDWRIAVLQ